MGVARDERAALCTLFTEVGPDAPTLCGGWLTRDLAAHLVVRERRLDAAPGILLPPLAGHLAKVTASYTRRPWAELVDLVRVGPPAWSPFKPLDELINTTEFFVHHEDVRRGGAEWEPRPADPRRDGALWSTLGRQGKVLLRKSPVGVKLRSGDRELVAKKGPDEVTLVGEPGEILLFAFGRDKAAVTFEGSDASVAAVKGMPRGF
ncbi:TIGR03085 family metal-binding protein [Actinokineospora bangkokensis]|uniref:TIGR03085 family protein n=1 Tax=Actinokineospora bangkokensis TaxID=1193682 RepID=A0A1Q9LQ48_9PSEU|nr:TIGR03085 family metal-binding protein [Actinokineospora bangkokensis]OLR94152.1 TIGR03085 family protein [Actinokineospora bangkokensis]